MSGLRGITGSPQSSIFATQNQTTALVIYSPQRKRNSCTAARRKGGGGGVGDACVCRRGTTATLPVLPSGTLACQSKRVLSRPVPAASPGSPGSCAFLPSAHPGELIFYLSALEMRREDPPRPEASWQAGAWGSPGEDSGGGLCPLARTRWGRGCGSAHAGWGSVCGVLVAPGSALSLPAPTGVPWGCCDERVLPPRGSPPFQQAPQSSRLGRAVVLPTRPLPPYFRIFVFWLRLKLRIDDARENQTRQPAKTLQPLLESPLERSGSRLSSAPFNCALPLPPETEQLLEPSSVRGRASGSFSVLVAGDSAAAGLWLWPAGCAERVPALLAPLKMERCRRGARFV